MKRGIVLLLCAVLALPGCASTRTTGAVVAPTGGVQLADRAVLAEYVQRLQLGSTVRVDLTDGSELRGTLMKVTDRSVIIQPRTRVPEPPLEIPLQQVIGVTLDAKGRGGSLARSIGVGAAVGVGAALGFMLILIAALD